MDPMNKYRSVMKFVAVFGSSQEVSYVTKGFFGFEHSYQMQHFVGCQMNKHNIVIIK